MNITIFIFLLLRQHGENEGIHEAALQDPVW